MTVPLLDGYVEHMPALNLPDRPAPKWGRIASLVLAPAGSAPGIDGEPYEIYQIGHATSAAY